MSTPCIRNVSLDFTTDEKYRVARGCKRVQIDGPFSLPDISDVDATAENLHGTRVYETRSPLDFPLLERDRRPADSLHVEVYGHFDAVGNLMKGMPLLIPYCFRSRVGAELGLTNTPICGEWQTIASTESPANG
jgi:hypothetical protein